MMEKVYLDMLTHDNVSVMKQNFVLVDNQEYPIGQPWRRAYVNSEQGRRQVASEISEPYKTAIFTVWGDGPTVTEIQ